VGIWCSLRQHNACCNLEGNRRRSKRKKRKRKRSQFVDLLSTRRCFSLHLQGMKACLTETVRLRYLLLAYCLFYSVSVSECGTCPAGWQEGYNENVCLSLMTSTNDWNDSESTCVAKGGHLASLDTREEYQYLQSICTSGTTDGCWVGGHEVNTSSPMLPLTNFRCDVSQA
jgi:hypothetical protein